MSALWDAETPQLILGTATFGSQCDEAASREIIDHAVDRGVRWLDTATSYPLGSGPETVGVTEEIIGRAVRGRRDHVRIATKVYNRTGPAAWQLGLSKRHVLAAVDGSLRRLQTDHIDLLQLHRFDAGTPLAETVDALGELVRAGKIGAAGCCNFDARQLSQYLDAAGSAGLRLQTAQTRYSLVRRGAEIELIPSAVENNVDVLAFNVLAGGLLTGKYDRSAEPAESARFGDSAAGERYRRRYWTNDVFDCVDAVREIAADVAVSMPVLAAAWVLHQTGIAAMLVGVTRLGHLDDALAAANLVLDETVLSRLDAASVSQRREIEEITFESS